MLGILRLALVVPCMLSLPGMVLVQAVGLRQVGNHDAAHQVVGHIRHGQQTGYHVSDQPLGTRSLRRSCMAPYGPVCVPQVAGLAPQQTKLLALEVPAVLLQGLGWSEVPVTIQVTSSAPDKGLFRRHTVRSLWSCNHPWFSLPILCRAWSQWRPTCPL